MLTLKRMKNRWLPLFRFTDLFGRPQCVAVAGVAPRCRSLPAWCTACRSVLPGPPSRLPSSVGAGLRSALPAAWHLRPSAPEGLPPCLRGRPDDRCAATDPPSGTVRYVIFSRISTTLRTQGTQVLLSRSFSLKCLCPSSVVNSQPPSSFRQMKVPCRQVNCSISSRPLA